VGRKKGFKIANSSRALETSGEKHDGAHFDTIASRERWIRGMNEDKYRYLGFTAHKQNNVKDIL
jgi:hypothetical protein